MAGIGSHWIYRTCCNEFNAKTGVCSICTVANGCFKCCGIVAHWVTASDGTQTKAVLSCESCRDAVSLFTCGLCHQPETNSVIEQRFGSGNNESMSTVSGGGKKRKPTRSSDVLAGDHLYHEGELLRVCSDCRKHGDLPIVCWLCEREFPIRRCAQQLCCPRLVCKTCHRACTRLKTLKTKRLGDTTNCLECAMCREEERCATCAAFHVSAKMLANGDPCPTCPEWTQKLKVELQKHVISDLANMIVIYANSE